jgi:hypothetical protein
MPMEQHVFYFSIDYRGRHRKGFNIQNATEVSRQQKLWLHQTKMYFNFRRVKDRKKSVK